MDTEDLEYHPYAQPFPLLGDDALLELAEDIKARGLRQPILLFEGKILDGRNRYQACQLAEVASHFEEYTGDDPLQQVVSLNLRRRHLTTDQRAAIAAELTPLYEEDAKKRQLAALKQGQGEETPSGSNEPNWEKGRSAAKAAAAMGVSESSVKRAKNRMRNNPAAHEDAKKGKKSPRHGPAKGSTAGDKPEPKIGKPALPKERTIIDSVVRFNIDVTPRDIQGLAWAVDMLPKADQEKLKLTLSTWQRS